MIMNNNNKSLNNYTQILRNNVDDSILGENTLVVGEKSWIFPIGSADDTNFGDAELKKIKKISSSNYELVFLVKNKTTGKKVYRIPVTIGCVIEMSLIEACDCMLGLSILDAQIQINSISTREAAVQVVGIRKYWEEDNRDENCIIYEPNFVEVDKVLYDTETYYTGDKLPFVPTSVESSELCYLKSVGKVSENLYKMTLQVFPKEAVSFETEYFIDNTSEIRLNYNFITGGNTFTGTSMNTCKVRITNLNNNQVGFTIVAIDERNLEN